MDWFGVEIDGPIVVVRTIHFAATATMAGALMFRAVVAEPSLRSAEQVDLIVDRRIRALVWICVALSIASGVAWLLLQTSAMSGETYSKALMSGALVIVLNETQFGLVMKIRLVFVLVLAVCLAYDRFPPVRWLGLGSSLCLTVAIAWTGHAGSTPYQLGYLHLTADALHLLAASAWTGGLVSLVLLLAATASHQVETRAALELDAVRRFSSLGIVSVATLVGSGIVNGWILVGSFRGLGATTYGRVLMLKVAIFLIMVSVATVNRFFLAPRLALSGGGDAQRKWAHGLRRNALVEIVLAFLVFAVVGLLGTLHPAAHLVN
jgi:putative copper resistance protein D